MSAMSALGAAAAPLSHNGDGVRQHKLVAPPRSPRSANFDLLKQLQAALRTVILTVTVSKGCMRCSDKECQQLFRLIRACFLAGCSRISGADPGTNDFLFLLVVPEFAAHFFSDIDFIAYLCTNRALASFAKEIAADVARVVHFYQETSIMRDEELHLTLVSSLLALENVVFHADSKRLSRQCLAASLDGVHLLPVPWPMAEPRSLRSQENRRLVGSRPDCIEADDFGALVSAASEDDPFAGFIATGSRQSTSLEKATEAPAPADDSKVEVDTTEHGPSDEIPSKSDADNISLQFRQLMDVGMEVRFSAAMLEDTGKTLVLGEESDSEEASAKANDSTQGEPLPPAAVDLDFASLELAHEQANQENERPWTAKDLEAPVREAFGLDVESPEVEPESTLSLLDIRELAKDRRRSQPRSKPLGLRARIQSAPFFHEASQHSLAPSPIRGVGSISGASELRSCESSRPGSPSTDKASASGGRAASASSIHADEDEVDEAADAVTSLEGLWEASRREHVGRLFGSASCIGAGGALPYNLARVGSGHQWDTSSGRDSPVSSTVASPRGSSVLSASWQGYSAHDDAASDSGSEPSSGHSVSGMSHLGSGVDHDGSSGNLAALDVRLEWSLKVRQKLPQATQIALQRGLCLGCKERLQSSMWNQPLFCYYLGGYFCSTCNKGETRVIPARVAERWDFKPWRVCVAAAKFLDSHKELPLMSISRIRRTKVSSQNVLTEIHILRQKLARIKELCERSQCDFLHNLITLFSQSLSRHVVQGHEMYSLQDLINIESQGRSCALYSQLSQLVEASVQHITGLCEACAAQGDQCIICGSGTPLYPFDVLEYYSCPQCEAIYHRTCFRQADSQCLRCMRRGSVPLRPSISEVRPR